MAREVVYRIALCLLLNACGEDKVSPRAALDGGAGADAGWLDAAQHDGQQVALGALRINEIDCNSDTVELFNLGDQPIELSGYTLSDDVADPSRREPAVGSLKPGAYGLVTVTAFGIACSGESLSLLQGETVVDSSSPASAPEGASWGRLPDGSGALTATLPTPGKANVAWSDLSVALFQPLGEASQIDLILDEQAIAALTSEPKVYVQGTLTLRVGAQQIGPLQVGVRLKGGLGSFQGFERKPAFKIDADRFVPGQRILGLEKLTLNNTVQDPSTVHEWLGYTVFASVGVPTPRLGFAKVSVNGDDYGAHLLIESFGDENYIQHNFASTLAIFEGEVVDVDVVPEQVAKLELDHGEEVAARAALSAVANKLAMAQANQVYSSLQAEIDFDEVLRELAADHMLDNGDGYSSRLNNYGIHLDAAGKLSLLPWGLDRVGETPIDLFAGGGVLFLRCMEDLACTSAYLAAMQSTLDAVKGLVAKGLFTDLRRLGTLNAQRYAGDRVTDASAIAGQVEQVISTLQRSIASFESELACQSTSGVDGDDDGRKCLLDCQDNEPLRYHGAREICGDGVDQDCNGEADDGRCGG